MNPDISAQDYERIAELIRDESSPVGIDAQKTHVLILHKLIQLEQRLTQLERQLSQR